VYVNVTAVAMKRITMTPQARRLRRKIFPAKRGLLSNSFV